MAKRIPDALKSVFVDFFSLKGFIEDQATVEAEIKSGVSFKGTNILILIMAILIASLGLNTNSTAVIIGAMLISPLMGPIIGIGLGIGVQDFRLVTRGLRNLAMAAVFSVIASTLFFLVSPVGEGHSELLARTNPTIYDVLIAFVGGGAGIVGIASRSKGNVIPGVAIATALMPPLCTAGYGLATWQLSYFFGASYLFLINSIFIAFATFIGVKLLGFVPQVAANPDRARRVRRWVYTLAIFTMLPSIFLTYNMLRESRFAISAQRFVANELVFSNTHVLSEKATISKGHRQIDIALIGQVLPVDSLRLALEPRLGKYGLEGTTLNFIQGSDLSTRRQDESQSTASLFNVAQESIISRQMVIDSLRSVLNGQTMRDTVSAAMAPELRVVFPQVEDISISRNVVCNVATGRLDTLEVALVRYSKPVGTAETQKLQRYLEARIESKEVVLINVTGSLPRSRDGGEPGKK